MDQCLFPSAAPVYSVCTLPQGSCEGTLALECTPVCVTHRWVCVLTRMCAGSTCACGHLFIWWCVPWCTPPDCCCGGECMCTHMCVQVHVCTCVIYMCALSACGQTPDPQTRALCPSCREQVPSSSSICLRAQFISPYPSLHLSFLPCTRGWGWGGHPPQGPSRGEQRQRFCKLGPVGG